MSKKFLASLCLAGTTFASFAGPAALNVAHAADKTVAFKGDSYTISAPSSWSSQNGSPQDLFSPATEKHFTLTGATVHEWKSAADSTAMAVLVIHSATNAADLKNNETLMLNDGPKPIKPITYQTVTINKQSFLMSTSMVKDGNGNSGTFSVTGISYKGKTFYFLTAVLAKGSATPNMAPAQKVLDTIALQ